jgi:hypothetical protein
MAKRQSRKKTDQVRLEAIPQWRLSPWMCTLILLFVVGLFLFIRVRLRDVPLERDEGEYAYAGQLMLQGISPYKLAYNMKLPGNYAAYAVILGLFGQSIAAVHLGLLVVNAATTIMMFFLALRLFGEIAGVTAAAAYALLSSGTGILGLEAHATHFVILAAVGGLIVLNATGNLPLLFCSGMLFGLAFVMKQPGIFFAVFALLYLGYSDWRSKLPLVPRLYRLGVLSLGIAAPFVITCIIMLICGVFGRFWFWVIDYAREYGSVTSLGDGFDAFVKTVPKVVGPSIGIWLLAAIGATAFVWNKGAKKHSVYCFGLLLFSFIAVCPGLFFRPHYFILMLPIIALLTGLAVSSATTALLQRPTGFTLAFLPSVFFFAAFAYAVIAQRDIFFQVDPVTACRLIYPNEPFPETPVVSEYIRKNSDSRTRIAMLGSDPEVYFYSQRHSATGYIYTFPLTEEQPYASTMQAEMIAEVETSDPEYLVLHPGGWAMMGFRGYQERLEWLNGYVQKYDLVGIVDRVSPDKSEFHWDQDARAYQPHSPVLYVFRRKRT